MALYKTPGVYVEETSFKLPLVTATPTAIPVFVGYTERAEKNGQPMQQQVVSIRSMPAYQEIFGGPFQSAFKLATTGGPFDVPIHIGGKSLFVAYQRNNELYLYNAVRLFYENGGGECCIVSVGTYEMVKVQGVRMKDFTGNAAQQIPSVFSILNAAAEPTLLLFPDIVAMRNAAGQPKYYSLYKRALRHCRDMQYRMLLTDPGRSIDGQHHDAINLFRNSISDEALSFGAAYYPWLQTNIVSTGECSLPNFRTALPMLLKFLPAAEKNNVILLKALIQDFPAEPAAQALAHSQLLSGSASYAAMVNAVKQLVNRMPASAAVAGVMNRTDNERGVWKAPANVALQAVLAPDAAITNLQQEWMNVDASTGKSVNAIRSFQPGQVLLWGARTLAGNDNEWRYISIKRTAIMIERSVKLALQSFYFEPNDANTWVRIQAMGENFLYQLWRQGAFPGAKPEEAFAVRVGLGVTMTASDILQGILSLQLMVAFVRPAEFTVIRIQQNMAKP